MALITVGTMAFDAIETPFGKVDKIIGGSATYVAYAAANFVTPIQQISIVGNDFPQAEMDELTKRGVELDGVEAIENERGRHINHWLVLLYLASALRVHVKA